jgi:hypothetical protein
MQLDLTLEHALASILICLPCPILGQKPRLEVMT